MEAHALVRSHIVEHLEEAVQCQANQPKADRHRDDVGNVVADHCRRGQVR